MMQHTQLSVKENATSLSGSATNGESAAVYLADNRAQSATIQKKGFHRGGGTVQRVANDAVVQRVSIEEDKNALHLASTTTDDPLLKNILNEALEMLSRPTTTAEHGPSPHTSHMDASESYGPKRKHEIVVDPEKYPSPLKRQSILLHETIHASADKKYSFNRKNKTDAYNIVDHKQSTEESGEQLNHQVLLLKEILIKLKNTVIKERMQLGYKLADHMIDRINRAIPVPAQEFDTIITELYYYLRMKRPELQSGKTFTELQKTAGAAYNARNKGKYMRDSFKKDLPELDEQRKPSAYADKLRRYKYLPVVKTLSAQFNQERTAGVRTVEESESKDARGEYERILMRLFQIQLEQYGRQATHIATNNNLDVRNRRVTNLNEQMDLRVIKAWLYEAKVRLDAKWFFKGALTTAVADLNTIIGAFKPLKQEYRSFEQFEPQKL